MTDSERRERNKHAVREFLSSIRQLKIDYMMSFYAEDGVSEYPFHAAGMPPRFNGRKELEAFMRGIPNNFEYLGVEDIEFHDMLDPDQLWVEANGVGKTRKGKDYTNRYCIHYTLRDGKIIHYREYYDPRAIRRVFVD